MVGKLKKIQHQSQTNVNKQVQQQILLYQVLQLLGMVCLQDFVGRVNCTVQVLATCPLITHSFRKRIR